MILKSHLTIDNMHVQPQSNSTPKAPTQLTLSNLAPSSSAQLYQTSVIDMLEVAM